MRLDRTVLRAVAPAWTDARPADHFRVAAADGSARYAWSCVIDGLPQSTGEGWDSWLAPLLRLDGTVRLAVHIAPLSDGAARLWLTMQESGHAATTNARAKQGWVRNRTVEDAARDTDRVQQEYARGISRVLRQQLVLTLEAETADALAALKADAQAYLNRQLLGWRDLYWRHDVGYTAQMVDGPRPLWAPRLVNTSTVAYTWPTVATTVSMDDGPLWGIATQDDQPVLYDVWNTAAGVPAPHVLVFGQTGGGKTTTCWHVWSQYAADPDAPDMVLVDPKGDYRRIVAELDGQSVAISTAAQDAINILDLPPLPVDPAQRAGFNPVDEAVEHVTGFLQLACGQRTPLTDEEVALAHRAILAAYAHTPRGISRSDPGTWVSIGPGDVPVLRDVVGELEVVGAHALAVRLEPYASGIYSSLFGRRTTLRGGHPFVVFDLSELSTRLRPLASYLIAAHVWQRARRTQAGRRLLFGMDELAKLLEHPATARLVGDMYALGRSFGLSVWGMTQLREDCERNDEGRRALQNAHTVLEMDGGQVGVGTLHTPRGSVRLRVTVPPIVRAWLTRQADEGDRERLPSSPNQEATHATL